MIKSKILKLLCILYQINLSKLKTSNRKTNLLLMVYLIKKQPSKKYMIKLEKMSCNLHLKDLTVQFLHMAKLPQEKLSPALVQTMKMKLKKVFFLVLFPKYLAKYPNSLLTSNSESKYRWLKYISKRLKICLTFQELT